MNELSTKVAEAIAARSAAEQELSLIQGKLGDMEQHLDERRVRVASLESELDQAKAQLAVLSPNSLGAIRKARLFEGLGVPVTSLAWPNLEPQEGKE